jgi:hypothetical protein
VRAERLETEEKNRRDMARALTEGLRNVKLEQVAADENSKLLLEKDRQRSLLSAAIRADRMTKDAALLKEVASAKTEGASSLSASCSHSFFTL